MVLKIPNETVLRITRYLSGKKEHNYTVTHTDTQRCSQNDQDSRAEMSENHAHIHTHTHTRTHAIAPLKRWSGTQLMFGVMEFVWEENAGAKLRDQPDCDDVCFQEHHSNDCSRHKRKKPRMTWFPFVEKTIKKGTWMNQLLIRSKERCWVF